MKYIILLNLATWFLHYKMKMSLGLFTHGTFLLVDQNRNIRGIYEGTDESEINRLIKDIEILLPLIP